MRHCFTAFALIFGIQSVTCLAQVNPDFTLDSEESEILKPDLSQWQYNNEVKGARLQIVSGSRAGMPMSSMAVRKISKKSLQQLDIKKLDSGIYLLDLDYIPQFLPAALKSEKLQLSAKGMLMDSEGNEAILMIGGETGLIKASAELRLDADDASAGITPRASPYPFRCYSFHPWAVFHKGFHMWYDSKTFADAFTSDPKGNCSSQSAHTNIEYLQTYVVISGGPDIDYCFNCSSKESRDIWDVGYFWPAHGTPTTYHQAIYRDGSIYFTRSGGLTW